LYLNFSGSNFYKMWQSMIETAKSNPFGNPFQVAHCQSSDKDLVPGRTVSAAATSGVTFETGG
jgi:hypothetical protein